MYCFNVGDEKSYVYLPPGQNDMSVQICFLFILIVALGSEVLCSPRGHWTNSMLFEQALLSLNTDGFTILGK